MESEFTLQDTQSCASDCPNSPSESSWDGIFEASDLLKGVTKHGVTAVKNALFLNNEQGTSDNTRASLSHCFNVSVDSLSKLLYPSHFKLLAAKVALHSGKPHLSSRGKVRLARQVRRPCHLNCKRCKNPRLTDVERETIFKRFWSFCNHELQWKFISDSVQVAPPKRKSAILGTARGKKVIRYYYLTVNGTAKKVCKTMFKNTLCICDSWIDSALSHFPHGNHIPDNRGKVQSKHST